MKNSLKIFVAFMLLITSSISYSEYKVISDLFVFELPGADAWDSGEQYSIKTAWEETGEETCDPWSPEAIDQIMSFTQERSCGVEEAREVTVREYNTSFDIYRTVNTFTETQTVGVTRARNVNFSADAWTVAQDLYNCSAWRPDPNTVDFGETFTQTRDCKIDEERNAQLALNTGEVLSSFVDTRTVDAQDTQQNTGTFQDWNPTESTFTQWTDTGAPFDYTSWTPVVAEQTADFTQSRNYQQTQERFEQQRELDAVTGDVRVVSTSTETRTIDDSASRTVTVSESAWSNDGGVYGCGAWSPALSNQTSDFTQTRSCSQDQTKTYTYSVGGSFTAERTTTVSQSQVVEVTSTAGGSGDGWSNWSTYDTSCGGWGPSASNYPQGQSFTQTRSCTDYQERLKYFVVNGQVVDSDRETRTNSRTESREATGTQAVEECRYDSSSSNRNYYYYVSTDYDTMFWDNAVVQLDDDLYLQGLLVDSSLTYEYKRGDLMKNVSSIVNLYEICRVPYNP